MLAQRMTGWSAALVVVLSTVAVLSTTAAARADDGDKFAAIAYSPGTHSYGYAANHSTREEAEQEALAQCSGDDARLLGWVQNGWLSLAVGDGAFSCSLASTAGGARKDALAHCREVTTNSRIVVTVSARGAVRK